MNLRTSHSLSLSPILALAVFLLGACASDSDPEGGADGSLDAAAEVGASDVDQVTDAPDSDDEPAADADAVDATSAADTADGADIAVSLPATGAMRSCLDDAACSDRFVVAHRGLRTGDGVPENSLAALRATAAAGIPMAEIDIRSTSDGVLVLMHDSTVQRTTDGRGEIDTLSWAEVQELVLQDGDPTNPDATHVPTFEEALAVAAELSLALYLDIKDAEADTIVAAVRSAEYFDMALFRDGVGSLVPVAALAPDAWLLAPVNTVDEAMAARETLPTLRMVEIADPQPDPTLAAALHAAGFQTQQDVLVAGDALWTFAGDDSGWRAFFESGVHLLQSDAPVDFQAAIRTWEEE
jgi:glycerophosphoryl diester phosphodiesterase